jgi:asparagine N-glycosylation enzyme membrane subunit Stt3
MKGVSLQKTSTQKFERFLAVLGTAVCLTDSIQVWQVIGAQQEMWPLPGLYLLEMVAVSALFLWAIWGDGDLRSRSGGVRRPLPSESGVGPTTLRYGVLREDPRRAGGIRGTMSWVAVGVLVAFVIMGAWSVGFLYAPVALLFIIAAILSDRRAGHNLLVHFGVAFAAALAQAAMMLAVISLR